MNKSQLVDRIASKTNVARADVAKVVDAFLANVTSSVAKGEKVVLSGFGTFHRKARARRMGRDIAADAPVAVPATSVPAFRPGKPFRELVARQRGRGRAPERRLGRERSKAT